MKVVNFFKEWEFSIWIKVNFLVMTFNLNNGIVLASSNDHVGIRLPNLYDHKTSDQEEKLVVDV